MVIDPHADGVDHINVYSRGQTELGRQLSNFSPLELHHPEWGYFRSMEGLWHFIATGCQFDHLRTLYGYPAKSYGRQHQKVDHPSFEAVILSGHDARLDCHPNLWWSLITCPLPLCHYYVYGRHNDRPAVRDQGLDFQLRYLESVRRQFQSEE